MKKIKVKDGYIKFLSAENIAAQAAYRYASKWIVVTETLLMDALRKKYPKYKNESIRFNHKTQELESNE